MYKRQPYDIFKHFGFQSGRDVDKFADWPDDLRTVNGVRYIGKHTNAVLSARVIDSRDCGTQMLYIAEVVEAHVLDVYKRQAHTLGGLPDLRRGAVRRAGGAV